jgi:hypothetical protein
MRYDEADLNVLCTCGHRHGDHYIKPGWPACGECSDCREYTATENRVDPVDLYGDEKTCEAGFGDACGATAVVKCGCCALWLCDQHTHPDETAQEEADRLTGCEP